MNILSHNFTLQLFLTLLRTNQRIKYGHGLTLIANIDHRMLVARHCNQLTVYAIGIAFVHVNAALLFFQHIQYCSSCTLSVILPIVDN